MGENFQNLVATAHKRGHKLVSYFRMDSREFSNLGKDERGQNWWKVLRIDRPSSFVDKNHVKSLDTLVALYRQSKWLECSDSAWLRKLITDGQVICTACFKKDSVLGAIACRTDHVERHLKTPKHDLYVKEYDESQPKIDKAQNGAGIGGTTYVDKIKLDDKRRYEALVVGTLADGGDGAAGIPPSSIHQHFCKDVLDIIGYELKGGIPTSDTIINTTLPNAIELIEGRIKDLVKDTKIALYIDGGSASHLALGRKVMVLCASSQAPTLAKLLFLRGNSDIMRAALRDANALRMKATQAKAAQEKAASTSAWNASMATNEQPNVDAIVVDDEEPVAPAKGRKKRKWRRAGKEDSSDNSEEEAKKRLAEEAKSRDWLGLIRTMRCGMP